LEGSHFPSRASRQNGFIIQVRTPKSIKMLRSTECGRFGGRADEKQWSVIFGVASPREIGGPPKRLTDARYAAENDKLKHESPLRLLSETRAAAGRLEIPPDAQQAKRFAGAVFASTGRLRSVGCCLSDDRA